MIVMNKTLCVIICLTLALNAFSQKILYTNNSLSTKAQYGYFIIGKANNNILVWQVNAGNHYTTTIHSSEYGYHAMPQTDARKHYNSKILVYNNNMQLINTVNTNILESFVDVQPFFLTSQNCFRIIYSCLDGDTLSNKVAVFDANGNMKTVETLYSTRIKKQDLLKPDYSYSILKSNNKKNTCFIKTTYDESNYNLKFNYSFIDDRIINKTFSFSIDVNKKVLTSMNIDNDKNLLLVFEEKQGDSCTIEIMRKNFFDDLMLVADKTLKAGSPKDHSTYITQNATGYILFRELNDLTNKNLFVWQTDKKLDDIASDTVINENFSGIYSFIPSENNRQNTFVIWNDYKNYIQPKSSTYIFYKRSSYTCTFSNNSTEYFTEVPLKNIKLFHFDSHNSITWSKTFENDDLEGKAKANMNNLIVVEGNKNLHVFYEVQINSNPKFLNHIIVNADGVASEQNSTMWNMKYQYFLDRGKLIDDNTLIVPAVKGNNMCFTKLTLE